MKILLLNWKDIRNPAAGGAEIVAFQIAQRLVQQGHSVTFFARTFPQAPSTENSQGIRVIRQGGLFSVYVCAWWHYHRLAVKPDLVIDMVNTLPWFTPWYVPRQQRLLYVNQLAAEVFFYHLPPLLSWLAYLSERLLYLSYQTTSVVCISKSTKKDLCSIGLPAENIHVYPLGIDHRQYYPSEEKEAFPLFVFVGRLVKMKRAETCIEAMRIVADRYPHAKLVILGQGPEKQSLQSSIHKLRLDQNVSLLSNNDSIGNEEDKVHFLQKSWALLLPSVKEGWGMVVIEAAASGTPSIVSNVSGLKDSVINRKTGLVGSPLPTPQELAHLMLEIIEQPSLREDLSRGALAWSKKFSWEKSYQRIKEIIDAQVTSAPTPM